MSLLVFPRGLRESFPIAVSCAVLLVLAPGPGHAQGICDGISQASGPELTSVIAFSGLSRPTLVVAPLGDTSRLFILEQDGRVRVAKDGQLLATPILDISAITRSPADLGDNDEGLLGLAFHPNYATNGWVFVYHTDNTGANNIVARYTRSTTNPDVATPTSRAVVISIAHPTFGNHNGGMIAFARDDGYLYIGTGDGGGGCDLPGNSQSLTQNRNRVSCVGM